MNIHRIILLVIVLVLIGGAIMVLESRKVSPVITEDGANDIFIEEVFMEAEDTVSTTTDDLIESSEEGSESMTKETPPEDQALSKTQAEIIEEKATRYERAKEISTPDAFINTDPITVRELIGEKIILVDFWTYSCINCQRTTPYLNAWHEKYADDGLVILGIHTPEFEFEKDLENVERAVEQFEIEYPVILDNDYSTWGSYRNRYWPRKYLIDIHGFIVYDHIGEGAYDETEAKIVELLNEKNEVLGMEHVLLDGTQPENTDEVDFTKIRTRESYFGSGRIEYIANLPSEDCFGAVCTYEAPEDLPRSFFALDGDWRIRKEESVLVGDEGSIHSHFTASKVHLVAGSDEPVEAEVYLNGELISDEFAGTSVTDGIVTFQEHTLYNLVDLKGEYGTHMLEIRFKDSDISVFAFTFG